MKTSASIVAWLVLGFSWSAQGSTVVTVIDGYPFQLPDGFEIRRVAGPPLVERPMLAAFDSSGRLYVCDSAGVNAKGEELALHPPDVIRVLEDTDGDGLFDRSSVFADQLVFPQGILWLNGAVYVSSAPQFLRLRDTDGDGKADQRDVLATGFPNTGCADDMHGANLGRDGRIYWFSGRMNHDIKDRDGRPVHRGTSPLMFRVRPDGSEMEMFCGVLGNAVGVSFDPVGNGFVSGTFMADDWMGEGVRDGLIHTVYGGEYPIRGKEPNELKKTGRLLPPLAHLGAAAASDNTLYEGDAFGPAYRGNLFSCLFNMHRVLRHPLVPAGATFQCTNEDFLVSDNYDFHPTDVLEDADGSLLILDTGGWFRICCPSSQLAKPEVKGAIYRVRRLGAPRPEDPRGNKIDWASASPEMLVHALDDTRAVVRERAVEALGAMGPRAVPALAGLWRAHGSVRARQNALWTAARITESTEIILAGLNDADPGVRQVAANVAGLLRARAAQSKLRDLVVQDTLPVRREAAAALGRLGHPESVPALLAGLTGMRDRFVEHAFIYALIQIGDREATQKGLETADAAVVRGALIALDQMEGGKLEPARVLPHLSSANPVLRETAVWITSHRPEWGQSVAAYLKPALAGDIPEERRAQLEDQLRIFAKEPDVQKILTSLVTELQRPVAMRLMGLRVMARASVRQVPPGWSAALRECLGSGDNELLRQTLATLQALPTNRRTVLTRTDPAIDFPGGEGAFAGTSLEENFGVRWTGLLRVATRGSYRLKLASDDGSRLRMDGRTVIDHDGRHALTEATGELDLTAGLHTLEVDYFQAGGEHGCILSWEVAGEWQPIPPAAFLHRSVDGALLPGLRGQFFGMGGEPANLPQVNEENFQQELFRIASDARRAESVRLAALAALPEGLEQVQAPLFAYLMEKLGPTNPPLSRVTVAGVLGRSHLAPDQLETLAGALAEVGALELPQLLPAYEGVREEPLVRKTITALGTCKGLNNLKAEQLRTTFAVAPAAVRSDLDSLLHRLETNRDEQKQRLAQLATALNEGDALRGSKVFNSPKAACTTCHRVGYLGGEVGPGLRKIGAIRSDVDLLEAVVYPSASFARGFEPLIVTTRDGEEYSGVVRQQDSDHVELVTGANTRVHLAREEIKEMRPGSVSVMPQGLDGILSPAELADLITFLKTL